jgi:Uncharacterized conserved protein
MSYTNLKDIYYKDNANYNEIYYSRFHSPATIKFPLSIKTKHENIYQLFVVILPEFLTLIEAIEKKINMKTFLTEQNAPAAFFQDYIIKLMINEIQLTNEIEGVYSKKEELEDALNNLDNSTIRYHFIVTKYNKLLAQPEIDLATPRDIRAMYDELLTNEIAEDDIPDGKLFRKNQVSVFSRTGSGKELHKGLYPEENIIAAINNLLMFINDTQCSFYIKLAVIHYYLGYIHPFYDGNGRLARFISTLLIAKEKSVFLAFKLSKIIKENIKKYDDNFDLANSEYNKGDLTSFVLMFLNILNDGGKEIINEMEYYTNRIKQVTNFLENTELLNTDIEKNIIFLAYQTEILDIALTVKSIANYLGKSIDTSRKHVNSLIKKGYIERGLDGNHSLLKLTEKIKKEINKRNLREV